MLPCTAVDWYTCNAIWSAPPPPSPARPCVIPWINESRTERQIRKFGCRCLLPLYQRTRYRIFVIIFDETRSATVNQQCDVQTLNLRIRKSFSFSDNNKTEYNTQMLNEIVPLELGTLQKTRQISQKRTASASTSWALLVISPSDFQLGFFNRHNTAFHRQLPFIALSRLARKYRPR